MYVHLYMTRCWPLPISMTTNHFLLPSYAPALLYSLASQLEIKTPSP